MSCDEWREDVSAWVDGELAPPRRKELDAHLKACRNCRRLAREFRELARLARSVPSPHAKLELTDAAMALVRGRETRKRWSWWPSGGMFWPQFSVGAAALAVAGFLAFVVIRGNGLPIFDHGGGSQKVVATAEPPVAVTSRPPLQMAPAPAVVPQPPSRSAASYAAAAPVPPASGASPIPPQEPGAPPIVGSLIVDNSTVGAERVAALARSLGGGIDTKAKPAQSTIYVSVPPSARGVFQARLPEIGAWQRSPSAEGGEAVVGIRLIQQP
jgi:Putative zinc-finger